MAYLINKYPVVQLISVNVTTIIRRISTKITLSKNLVKFVHFPSDSEMVTELAMVRAHLKVAPRAHLY